MPRANASEMRKALRVVSCSCWLMKPMISGMLAKWQGLSRMLNIPQMKAPSKPTRGWPYSSRVTQVKSASSTISPLSA